MRQRGEQGGAQGGQLVKHGVTHVRFRNRFEFRFQMAAQHFLQRELEQIHLSISRDQRSRVFHERCVFRQRQSAQRRKCQRNQRNFDELIQIADNGQQGADF